MWGSRASGVGACGVAVFVACDGGSTVVSVEDFDQSCQLSSDCVLVIDGDVCCGCPNAAINKGDLERYQDSVGECSAHCDIGCIDSGGAVCVAGQCQTQSQPAVCTPAAQVVCACAGGASGVKTCLDDGSGFGDCACM